MAPMTRTRARTYGVITPSTRQPLLAAMLRAFAWLVSNVASMFATIFNRTARDWHTDDARKDQLPTPNDLTGKVQHASQGTTPYSPATKNNNARYTAAYDASAAESARSSAPPPNGGGAACTPISTMAFRWGADLTTRPIKRGKGRTRRHTVPHLTCTRRAHRACSSSPVRGRTTPARA